MRAEEETLAWDELNSILKGLEVAINNSDHQELRNLLIKAVPAFKPQSGITDLLFSEKSEYSK